jgi:hypothetical protein
MPLHDSLLDSIDVQTEIAPQSMAAGAVNGAIIDTAGWDGVMFSIAIGAITGAGTLDAFVARSANSNFAGAVNINNASLVQVTNANPNSIAVIDVYRPAQRYLRLTLTQAANTVVAGANVNLYRRNGILPSTHTATQVVRVAEN